jgi:DNA-binding Lrp family transcriptional regulator
VTVACHSRNYLTWPENASVATRRKRRCGVAAITVSLDNIISALTWALPRWTPALKRNQSRDLLRLLICKLYGAHNGNLWQARVQASHDALAARIGISREWTCKLIARLVEAGWIHSHAPRLSNGRYLPCLFSPGPQLKRLLYVLYRYRHPRRSRHNNRVNDTSQSLPSEHERKKVRSFLADLRRQLSEKLRL